MIAVDFLDPAENPADPTHWDTQDHGTFVAGILAGDNLATPVEHDPGDGMAPGAKLVIQDAGYAADDCGDLPGLGCPVTDLIPIFQQAYDQGARVHNNSWNDNENAAIQNLYTDASEDVDEFMWNNPDFLILFGAGNQGYPGRQLRQDRQPGHGQERHVGRRDLLRRVRRQPGGHLLLGADLRRPDQAGRPLPGAERPLRRRRRGRHHEQLRRGRRIGHLVRHSGRRGQRAPRSRVLHGRLVSRPARRRRPTPSRRRAALVKAMLVNSAVSIDWDNGGNPITIPSTAQGWGRILLDNALLLRRRRPGPVGRRARGGFTSPGDPPVIYMLEMEDSGEPLKVTLAWTDYPSTPAATTHLVNDLDLRVDGAERRLRGQQLPCTESRCTGGDHDRLNNLEQVLIADPAPGVYSIRDLAPRDPLRPAALLAGRHRRPVHA